MLSLLLAVAALGTAAHAAPGQCHRRGATTTLATSSMSAPASTSLVTSTTSASPSTTLITSSMSAPASSTLVTTTTSAPASTTLATSSASAPPSTTQATSTTTGPPSTTVDGGAGPGTALASGYYWIRAVESPNFHKYLQTDPQRETGVAVLEDPTTAGQFQIVDGQLVELIDTKGTLLYANVEQRANSSVMKLGMTFEKTKNTYGTFSFSGDGVEWSEASIDRPNPIAWLVCEKQSVYINLGPYLYNTPAGCVDETIHYYNGATAVS